MIPARSPRALALCALAGLLLASGGCRRARPPENLLIVSIDTLRADHLSCYGYERNTTPHVDAFAAQAVLFERAYSHVPSTLPAMASVFTSKYPHHHGVLENYHFALGRDEHTLAERLAEAGLRTAAFVGIGILMPRRGFDQGFEDYFVAPYQSRRYWRPAREVTDGALAWLEEHHASRFFLWVHYFEPHQPYEMVPEEYRTRFAKTPLARVPDDPTGHTGAAHRRLSIDQYDGALAYVDTQVGRVLDAVRGLGLWDRTMIVLTADHGEGLGEHGLHGHVHLLYEPLVHVPLVVHVPGIPPARVSASVEHVDILPTVLARFGLPRDDGMDGRVLPLEGGGGPRDTFARLWVPEKGGKAAIDDGRWKLILSQPGFRGYTRELYDLAADPEERVNLAEKEAERTAELERRLRRWMNDGPVRPRPTDVGGDEAAMLRALGYVE